MTPSRTEAVETAKRYPFPRPGYSFLYVDGEAWPLRSLPESLEDAEVEVGGQTRAGRCPAAATRACRPGPAQPAYAGAWPTALTPRPSACGESSRPPGPRSSRSSRRGSTASMSSTPPTSPATARCRRPSPPPPARSATSPSPASTRASSHACTKPSSAATPTCSARCATSGSKPDLLPPMETASTYVGGYGHIAPDGAPLALAAIQAEGRRFRTCSQTEALQAIQAMLGVPGPLDDFILEAVNDEAVRQERTARLRARGAALFLRRLHAGRAGGARNRGIACRRERQRIRLGGDDSGEESKARPGCCS